MKMGFCSCSIGVMVVIATMMVIGTQVVEAQVVNCLSVTGGYAPYGDATAVVQQLRVRAGLCCPDDSKWCTVVVRVGNAAASVYGTWPQCPSCANVGNRLNQILSKCNVNNAVQGVFSPNGSGQRLLYLTANALRP